MPKNQSLQSQLSKAVGKSEAILYDLSKCAEHSNILMPEKLENLIQQIEALSYVRRVEVKDRDAGRIVVYGQVGTSLVMLHDNISSDFKDLRNCMSLSDTPAGVSIIDSSVRIEKVTKIPAWGDEEVVDLRSGHRL